MDLRAGELARSPRDVRRPGGPRRRARRGGRGTLGRRSTLSRVRLRAHAREEGGGMNLNSILIGSDDPKALRDYYTKIFGTPEFEEGDFAGWKIGNGYVTV